MAATLGLNKFEKEAIEAHNQCLRIRDFDKEDVKTLTLRLMQWSKALGVASVDPEVMSLIVVLIQKQYSDLSTQEICLAFEYALAGKLNIDMTTYQSFSLDYVTKILNAWREYLKKISLKPKDPVNDAPEITESQKNEMIRQGALRAFEEHKAKGTYCDSGNVIFNYLDKLKIIPFNTARRVKILEDTRLLLITEKKRQIDKEKDKVGRDQIKARISELENNNTVILISEARRRALNIFFEELQETGTELTDLLNETQCQ